MKFRLFPTEHIPVRYIAAGVVVLCLAAKALAEGDPSSSASSFKETAELFVVGAAVLAILGNIAWSFFNRKHYDRLNEIIAELKESLESKSGRVEILKTEVSEERENHRLQVEGMMAKHQLQMNEVTADVTRLRVSLEAVVGQNLQMKALLKQAKRDGSLTDEDLSGVIHESNE